MRKKVIAVMLVALLGATVFSGCGSEERKLFEQSNENLKLGNYEEALQGFLASVKNEMKLAESYRGAGIAQTRLGNYEEAISYFDSALSCEKVGKALEWDLMKYLISAEYKAGQYENAMADCQTLAEKFEMDADGYYLTGKVALALDSYDEASMNFQKAYVEDSTYNMAIQIYQAYIERDMEADGTKYLETALLTEPKKPEDYCDRGLAYYYMEDYEKAAEELIEAANQNSKEAILYLGMVYLAKNDISNARAMYQEYINKGGSAAKGYNGLALCDMNENAFDNAMSNISNGLAAAEAEEIQNLLFNEVVVYEKNLDFQTALQKAEEYLELFPEDKVMEKELAFLKTRV